MRNWIKSWLGFTVIAYWQGGTDVAAVHTSWTRGDALDWMRCYGLDWTVRMYMGGQCVAARRPV